MPTPKLSVCIVTGRRHDHLAAVLDDLVAQLDPPEFEVLIAADRDPDAERTVRARFDDALVGVVDGAWPGAARNFLVERASGDLLLFLDDDLELDPRLLRRFHDLATTHPEVDVFGGPNLSPRGSTSFQSVQGAVLGSIVGTGPVRRRYGRHPAGEADERFFTLCNLAIRRRAMQPFDVELLCAEENGVLRALSSAGARMHYDPGLDVFHERRATYRGFVQQMHKYGRGRGQLIRKSPTSLRSSFALAALLPFAIATSLLLAIVEPLLLLMPAVYLAAVAASAVRIAASLRRASAVPLAAALTLTLHACYGTGVVRGAARRPRTRQHAPATWSDVSTSATGARAEP